MSAWLLLLLAQAQAMEAAPVPDRVLAEQRGGFRLPNGIDVTMTVQTQTAVNGAVVLRTVFQADQGAPSLTIYAPKAGETVRSEGGAAATAARAANAPSVSYDSRGGIQVTPGVAGPAIAVTAGSKAGGEVPSGLVQVTPGTTTDNGLVTRSDAGGVRTVGLTGSDLSITHLAGNAFGSAIANSGGDRTIDTQTAVSIDLRNAGPDVLGSAMFRVQDIATNAAAMRVN